MSGGRPLSKLIRNNGWHLTQKIWNHPQAFRYTLPVEISPFTHKNQSKYQLNTGALISNRFFHRGNASNTSESFESPSKKLGVGLFAAFGLSLGIGSYAVCMADNEDVTLDDLYLAACAEDCIEKKCEDSACLRKMDCEEEMIMKANADLEKALKDVKSKAIEYTEAAMKAYCEAIAIMSEYMDQAYCVIDADNLETPRYEENWCCVYGIAVKRCEKVRDALQRGQCAWELLCRLREVIENGKACKYTSCNPLLITAEESLTCAEKELLGLKSKMDCVSSSHDMVETYRQLIDDFKKDLKCDLEEMDESKACKIQFAEQETALLINQSYKRVLRAHKEMALSLLCSGNVPERQQTTVC